MTLSVFVKDMYALMSLVCLLWPDIYFSVMCSFVGWVNYISTPQAVRFTFFKASFALRQRKLTEAAFVHMYSREITDKLGHSC